MTRSLRLTLLPAVLAAGCLATPAAAQERGFPEFAPDQRVRVTVPYGSELRTTAGAVAEVRADSMVLTINGMQETFALESIQRLEVSEGRGSRRRYALIGAAAGTGLGFGLGKFMEHMASEKVEYGVDCLGGVCIVREVSKEKDPLLPPVAVAVAGTAAGILAGALLPGDRWREVPLHVSADAGRVSLGLELRH